MIGLVPLVVTGGIVKKFSDSMLGAPKKGKKAKSRVTAKPRYPSGNRPF